MTAEERWAEALAEWAIPQSILAIAPESPWTHDVGSYARKAERGVSRPTRSHELAREALPRGGSVLDVGCGAGAASLPLADRAGLLTGVDESPAMLEQFTALARAHGVAAMTQCGTWPLAGALVPPADVVVCHHVVYNVQALLPFIAALHAHARRRVVIELSADHPLHHFNSLWLQFHGVRRPDRPTVDDALAVIREAGFEPAFEWRQAPPGPLFAQPRDLVAWARRLLCLPPDRDDELAAALEAGIVREDDGYVGLASRTVVTVWWDRGLSPA